MVIPQKNLTSLLALTLLFSTPVMLQRVFAVGADATAYKPVHGGYPGKAPGTGYKLPPLNNDTQKLAFLLELKKNIPALFKDAAHYDIDLFTLLENEHELVEKLKQYPEYDQLFRKKHYFDLTITPPKGGLKVGSVEIKPEAIDEWKASLSNQVHQLRDSGLATPKDMLEQINVQAASLRPAINLDAQLKEIGRFGNQRRNKEDQIKHNRLLESLKQKQYPLLQECLRKEETLERFECIQKHHANLEGLPHLPSLAEIEGFIKYLDQEKQLHSMINLALITRIHPDSEVPRSWDDFNRHITDLTGNDLILYTDKDDALIPQIKKLLVNGNEHLVDKIADKAFRRINHYASQVQTQQKIVTQSVKISQVLPHEAIFRGCTGGDCSSQFSFPYPNDPHERVFYVEDAGTAAIADEEKSSSDRKLKGYVSATEVLLPNKEKALYVITISGNRISTEDAELILRGLEKEKERLGVKHIIMPTQSNLGALINFPQIRGAYEAHIKGKAEEPISYQDQDLRSGIQNYRPRSGYNQASYDHMNKNSHGVVLKLRDRNPVQVKLEEHPDRKFSAKELTSYPKESIFEFLTDLRNSGRKHMIERVLAVPGVSITKDQFDHFARSIDSCQNEDEQKLTVSEFQTKIGITLDEIGLPKTFLNSHPDLLYPGIIECKDAFNQDHIHTTAEFLVKEMKSNKDSRYQLRDRASQASHTHLEGLRKTPAYRKLASSLTNQFESEDPNVRRNAVKVLLTVHDNPHSLFEKAFADSDSEVREGAAISLRNYKGPDVHLLFERAFADSNRDVRRCAAEALKYYKEPNARLLFEKAFSDSDRLVRTCAAEALRNYEEPDAHVFFEKAFSDSSPWVREKAAEALKYYKGPDAHLLFEKALSARDINDQNSAASALRQYDGPDVHSLFEKLLAASDENIRRRAASALGQRKRPDVHLLFEKLLAASDANVRSSAASALGKYEGPDARFFLDQALSDSNADVRSGAASALGNYKGPDAHLFFEKAFADRERSVRHKAAISLSIADPSSSAFRTMLIYALKNSDIMVRLSARRALNKIKPEKESKIDQCIERADSNPLTDEQLEPILKLFNLTKDKGDGN